MSGETYPPVGFSPEFLDFRTGIRVGRLEPDQRITRILKQRLQDKFGQDFVTDRHGRGVYWKWICYVLRANREAKPTSHHTNFGCAKFFISMDRELAVFKTGMQVERGYLNAPSGRQAWELQPDWDWYRLLEAVEGDPSFLQNLQRLMKDDGFHLQVGSWSNPERYLRTHPPSLSVLRDVMDQIPKSHWGGFQLYFPMLSEEVSASVGSDLVDAMMAVFSEVTPLMNACMQVRLRAAG